ncbi:hypothetical protein QJS10_CPB15g00835 [Acorus calamus]|uniref:Uncharacterized protein n=1 Tax=Acorus calamus TaxID=4465 RepID=A0AAV9D809_ACOCL|nr:hypothetical protein QJS10_CPB15g00835 [Acorus calamus]
MAMFISPPPLKTEYPHPLPPPETMNTRSPPPIPPPILPPSARQIGLGTGMERLSLNGVPVSRIERHCGGPHLDQSSCDTLQNRWATVSGSSSHKAQTTFMRSDPLVLVGETFISRICLHDVFFKSELQDDRQPISLQHEIEIKRCLIPGGLWAIWKTRNATIFDGQWFYFENLWDMISSLICEWGRVLEGAKKIKRCLIPGGLWAIWKTRNVTIFDGQWFYFENLWDMISSLICEWGRVLEGAKKVDFSRVALNIMA